MLPGPGRPLAIRGLLDRRVMDCEPNRLMLLKTRTGLTGSPSLPADHVHPQSGLGGSCRRRRTGGGRGGRIGGNEANDACCRRWFRRQRRISGDVFTRGTRKQPGHPGGHTSENRKRQTLEQAPTRNSCCLRLIHAPRVSQSELPGLNPSATLRLQSHEVESC